MGCIIRGNLYVVTLLKKILSRLGDSSDQGTDVRNLETVGHAYLKIIGAIEPINKCHVLPHNNI